MRIDCLLERQTVNFSATRCLCFDQPVRFDRQNQKRFSKRDQLFHRPSLRTTTPFDCNELPGSELRGIKPAVVMLLESAAKLGHDVLEFLLERFWGQGLLLARRGAR